MTRVHLVDGTYELFRQFFGRPSRESSEGGDVGAVVGVATSMLAMLNEGATHVGVATDHVIESIRNQLWLGYKDSSGVAPELLAQFDLLERALESLGLVVWPMVELEADDALASAAAVAQVDQSVDQVLICSPDKDLAQCVIANRVVQFDRRAGTISNANDVVEKFGVEPESIPDYLALVGDSADGFPGLAGWGKRSASVVLARYRHLEAIPDRSIDWDKTVVSGLRGADKLADTLARDRELAMLFKDLATLRREPAVISDVEELRWRGPRDDFVDVCAFLRSPDLATRAEKVAASRR